MRRGQVELATVSSSQDNSTPDAPRRRKKLTTIVFDTDFFMRPRTRLLIKEHGIEAASIYLAAICWMAYEESSDTIGSESVELLAIDLGVSPEKVKTVLHACVSLGYLELTDDGWHSARLSQELETVKTKQANYAAAAKNREAAKRSKSEQDSARLTKTENNPAPLSKIEHVRKEQEQEKEQEEDQEKEPEQERTAPPDIPDPELAKFADRHLRKATDLDICGHPLWVGAGKRPMKKYPHLWLTPLQLRQAADLYEKMGIPPADWHLGFAFVATRIDHALEQGKSITGIDAYSWLIGFGLTHALEQLSKSLKVKREQGYSEGKR